MLALRSLSPTTMSLTAGRARRTAGLLAAPGALVAVPAAAEGAGVRVSGDTLIYSADDSTGRNQLRLSVQDGEFVVSDRVGLSAGTACRAVLGTLVQGAGTPTRATANHGPGDDSAAIATGIPVSVGGGSGDDLFTDAGRPNFSTAVTFHGEAGFDSVSYFNATSGVEVNLNVPGDGRPGDRDDIRGGVELINGSRLDDTITGNELDQTIAGSRGNDTVSGLGGNDTFIDDSRPNGADTIFGGGGLDTLDLTRRTNGVTVRLDDARVSGEPGEADTYSGEIELVRGGSGAGTDATNFFIGGAGDDTLDGGGNFDQLTGGPRRRHPQRRLRHDMTWRRGARQRALRLGRRRPGLRRPRPHPRCRPGLRGDPHRLLQRRGVPSPRGPLSSRPGGARSCAWPEGTRPRGRSSTRFCCACATANASSRASGSIRRPGRSAGSAVELFSDGTSVAVRQGGATMTARLALRIARRHAGRTLTTQVAAVDDGGARQSFRTVGRIRVR